MSTPRPDAAARDSKDGQPKSSTNSSKGSPGLPRRTRVALGLLLLFVLGLGLRARAIEHGLPRNYVPDTHIVRSALGMAQEKNPVPPVGRYSTYPNLLPYALLPLYATQYFSGRLTGQWYDAQSYGDYVLEHPESVHLLARWLMVLLGSLTPLVVYAAARAAGLRVGAWAAAWLVATGLMHLHFSVQERPWVAVVFFAALSAWPAASYVREPTRRRLLLSGVCAALAAACHQSGFFVLGLPGLAWWVAPLGWRGEALRRRLVDGVLCVVGFFLLAVLVGYPSYLLHGLPSAEQTIGGDQADMAIGGQSINFGRRWATFPHLARSFFGYDPLLTIFALGGLVPLLRMRRALPAALFAVAWAAFFMTHSNEHVRYLLPLAVLLSLAGGAGIERLWERGTALRVALVVLAFFPLVQSVRLGSLLAREDSRAQGELALAKAAPEAFTAIDRYGPTVDLDQASLELLEELRNASGSYLYKRESRRLEALRAGSIEGGVHGVHVSDLFEIDELTNTVRVRPGLESRLGTSAAEAFEALGVTQLLLVDRLGEGISGSCFAEFAKGRKPSVVIAPFDSTTTNVEARLPMELEFPLTSIWALERPGPWMGMFPVRP